MSVGKVKISGGFVLLWAALLYIDAGRLLFPTWVCALLHELGHVAALKLCGGSVEKWELGAAGVCVRITETAGMSYPKEILCTLAGPLASFLCCLFFALRDDMIIYAGICAIQGLYNLLPVSVLDGGRVLRLVLMWKNKSEAPARIAGTITGLCLTAACVAAFAVSGYNPTLLLAGGYAVYGVVGDYHHRK